MANADFFSLNLGPVFGKPAYCCTVCKTPLNDLLSCPNPDCFGKPPRVKDKITSQFGGTRQPLSRRYDLLFQEFGDAIDAWAEIIDYGEKKHGHLNWHKLDFDSEQSPLNHAIGHLRKAAAQPSGSSYRRRQLAKVLWNVAAQMWYDSKDKDLDPRQEGIRVPMDSTKGP